MARDPMLTLARTAKTNRAWCRQPRGILYERERWTVASDGRAIVAARRAKAADEHSGECATDTHAILDTITDAGTPMRLPALRQFARRRLAPKRRCESCYRQGMKARAECFGCFGLGTIQPGTPVRVCGEMVDLKYLQRVLATAPKTLAIVRVQIVRSGGTNPMLALYATRWRAGIMGFIPSLEETPETIPAFPKDAP